jgi:anti-sigma factor RsiW
MPVIDDIEIIQMAIDGEATAEQETQLRRSLANSPETRATYQALRQLAQQLDSVPLVDPPPMRDSILPNLRPANVEPFHPRRRILLGLAYAAAAVIVIGVAVQRFVPPPHSASATMARLDTADWPLVAHAASPKAKIAVRGSRNEYVVEVTVSGEGPITVEWDGRKLSPAVGEATFQNQDKPIRLQLHRRVGASGSAVIRLRLPEKENLTATIDLR